ncbi:cytochrome oxidase small assembly protein [Pigmentiphaga litoralis]
MTPEQRRNNRRLGMLLAAVAIGFFLMVILRKVYYG